jgi:hypothetical protein
MASVQDIYAAIRAAAAANDGASVQKLGAYLQTLQSGAHTKAAADTAAWEQTLNPTADMNGAQTFLAGIGKGMTDLGRGVKERVQQAFGTPTMADLITGSKPEDAIAEARQVDAPLMATTSGKVGNVLGKVAIALPATMIPGANTLTGAALIGGAQGFLEPTTADESVGKNMLMGAAAGGAGYGATKVIGAGYRAGKAAIEPFYEAGKQRIIGRALNTAAGQEAPTVANRLAGQNVIVPGSLPTVGQAAENPGVAALERAATANTPSVTNAVADRLAAQNSARVNVLQDLAGSGGARDFAAANRDATANQLYTAARANGINPAALTPEAQANMAAMQARIPANVLADANQLAQIQGMPKDNSTAVAGLHYVKQALDDAIASAKASGNATRARALTGLQQDFLGGLDNLSPDYAAARGTYAAMSRPVNQMDVAQELLNRSVNPLTGTLQPAAYARALSDQAAQRATGFQGATLANTLEPEQLNTLQAILKDVQRATAANNVGRGVGSDTVQKLAYTNVLDQAGVPTFLRELAPAQVGGNLLARGADVVYGRQNRELGNRLAELMLNPEGASQAMSTAARADAPNALLNRLAPYLLSLQSSATPAVALSMPR